LEEGMPRRLHYYAQPFWRGRPGKLYPFVCAVDAEEGGRILALSAEGVHVFQQWRDEEAGTMDEPELLQVIGHVPDEALMIDPEGRDPWLDDIAYFKIDCSAAGDVWTQVDPKTLDAMDEDAA